MADVFDTASSNILESVCIASKGVGYLTHDGRAKQINVVIDKEVAIVNEFTESRFDDGVDVSDTATFEITDVSVGDSLRVGTDTWEVGRTVEKDAYLMTVVIE